jgi:hypothetical protein
MPVVAGHLPRNPKDFQQHTQDITECVTFLQGMTFPKISSLELFAAEREVRNLSAF